MDNLLEVCNTWGIECLSISLVAADNEGGTRLAFRYPDPTTAHEGRALSPEKFIPQLFTPKHILHNQIFELVISQTSRFISYCVSQTDWNTGIAAFNVVIEIAEMSPTAAAIDGHGQSSGALEGGVRDPSGSSIQRQSMDFLKRILVDIARSLNFEENRQKFVSQEVKYMLKVHDQVLLQSSSGPGSRKMLDYQSQLDVIFEHSTLANFLKKLYHAINSKANVQLQLNGFLRISETLAHPKACLHYPIRPYHSLILLKDKQETLRALPPGSSRDLMLLIQHSSPLKSFNEMQNELNISIKRIFVLAAHLMHWNFCVIIKAFARDNQYRVLSHSVEKAALFSQKFPRYSFADVLTYFRGSRRLGAILDDMSEEVKLLAAKQADEQTHSQNPITGLVVSGSSATLADGARARARVPTSVFLEMLAWLLQHECLQELHVYVYFNVPLNAPAPGPSVTVPIAVAAGTTSTGGRSSKKKGTSSASTAPSSGSDTSSTDKSFQPAAKSSASGQSTLDSTETTSSQTASKARRMSLEEVRRVIGDFSLAKHEAEYLLEKAQEEGVDENVYLLFIKLLKVRTLVLLSCS
eukprot:INCI14058.2.p1 GENE.INCI14058.2~~INCI14058.2.p1  ORF type:complete len:609 (-),score=107.21 INCI14058.2:345-2087(-)